MRVRRCFAFLDLSGFTALTDARGDEHAVTVLSRFRAIVREVCSRRGVRIAKWLGDGAMLVTVETRPLLEAVLEIEFAANSARDEVRIRAGVTEGPVILYEGDDYIGHAVNMAARLCELAPKGGVLADPAVTDRMPGWGAVTGSVELDVPGLGRRLELARLGLRPLAPPTSDDPVCGLPLRAEVADSVARDPIGREILFCSPSCRDTWDRRPPPPPEEHGALRAPLIGS
jgi:adenylate cyclase